MSERPTPETDALECAFALLKCSPIGNPKNSSEYGRAAYILSEHCQGKEDVSEAAMRIFAKRIADLERERDEAREALIEARKHREQLNSLLQSYEACWDEIKTTLGEPEEGDQTCDLDRVLKAIRERDEAREALAEWHDSALHVRQEYEDEQHCSCVPILRKLLKDAERERDEAIADRDIARLSALDSDRAHDRMVAELEKVYKERDDALSQIVQAECRAERFCQERDEAVAECKSLWSLVNANKLRAYKAERERDRLKEVLGYIAHAGLSARHIEDYAKEFLRREEAAK